MKTRFNAINNSAYVNNTDIISHCVAFINDTFTNGTNLTLKFRKPLLSQADFNIGFDYVDGHAVGEFYVNNTLFYVSYIANNEPLYPVNHNVYNIDYLLTTPGICYHMNNLSRTAVKDEFEHLYGKMTSTDKVIAAKFMIDDTRYFNNITKESITTMVADRPYHLGDRKFKIPIYVGDVLFCNRFSTVKEFNI